MTLSDIKLYLNGRSGTDNILSLSDEQLTKYMNTSILLLNTYYEFEQFTIEQQRVKIVAEQMIYISENNIDFQPYFEYNGLTSFNVAGSIQGTVDYSIAYSLFSRIVKGLLQYNQIDKITDEDSDGLTTAYAKV